MSHAHELERRNLKLLCALAAVALALLTVLRVAGMLAAFDAAALSLLSGLRSDGVTALVATLTVLFDPVLVAATASAVSVALLMRHRAFLFALFVSSLASAGLLSVAVKALFREARPDLALIVIGGWGYPSGHATMATAVALFAAYVAGHAVKRRSAGLLINAVAALAVLGVGASRVYLGVHYASDVAAGFLLGTLAFAAPLLVAGRFRR